LFSILFRIRLICFNGSQVLALIAVFYNNKILSILSLLYFLLKAISHNMDTSYIITPFFLRYKLFLSQYNILIYNLYDVYNSYIYKTSNVSIAKYYVYTLRAMITKLFLFPCKYLCNTYIFSRVGNSCRDHYGNALNNTK